MKHYLILFNLLFILLHATAQEGNNYTLKFSSTIDPNADSSYTLNNGVSVKLETFKFYLSNIQFLSNSKVVLTEPNSYHLIDFADTSSLRVLVHSKKKHKHTSVSFDIGIDSITSVSGAMSGALDPINGMYWTWQSGYINCKLEGKFIFAPSTERKFEYHLGGYSAPFASIHHITIPTPATATTLQLKIDLNQFFSALDATAQKNVLSPGSDAVHLLTLLAECLSAK